MSAPGRRAHGAGARAWIEYGLFAIWAMLLVLPSTTVFFKSDGGSRLAAVVSCGLFACLWLAVGTRRFFVITYPFAFFGVLAVAADMLRGVDLVEIAVAPMDEREVRDALAAYFLPIAGALLALAAVAVVAYRRPIPMPAPRARIAALVLLLGAAACVAIAMPSALVRAWPLNAVSVQVARATGRSELIGMVLPWAPVSPRLPGATWSARRTADSQKRETYVIVVGESVRADRLGHCGGHDRLVMRHALAVYCDVMAGSSRTEISVPLLLSREMPGADLRVSTDATVLRAFEETGFRSYWIGEQIPSVAWPDANVVRYARARSTSRRDLLPLIRAALQEPARKKALVLHTYDAHFPYCNRFDSREAAIAVDCGVVGAIPAAATRREWLAAYDNAVAETLAFLDAVIAELDASGEEAFLVYTSDHGENLLDDDRGMYFHALAAATRFDSRVPMIFWASAAWRRNHPAEARALVDHRHASAMHADLVPTLLGAAGISYLDGRKEVVDLAHAAPGARTRWIAPRLGVVVDGDQLK